MKTRSTVVEAPNIAAIVKARHHSISTVQSSQLTDTTNSTLGSSTSVSGAPILVNSNLEDQRPPVVNDGKAKIGRTDGSKMHGAWSVNDRRLFFQAVRLFGRNFTDITRFIRNRGHRYNAAAAGTSAQNSAATLTLKTEDPNFITSLTSNPMTVGPSSNPSSMTTSVSVTGNSTGAAGTAATGSGGGSSSLVTANASVSSRTVCGGRTREQVRFFYKQTWHNVRRYIKFPEDVPQHVREVYGIINYSVIRNRIKKPLHRRLGEKLNELVHFGTTMIKHNGRRFVLRTPTCPALRQLNHIAAPIHDFLLPEDIWVELVPYTQSDSWHVLLEAEQNPRLRLRVDINRQLSDVISLVEKKWQPPAERMQTLFDLPSVRSCPPKHLMIRLAPNQTIDGAICLHEVARIRSADVALRSFIGRKHIVSKAPSTSVCDQQQHQKHTICRVGSPQAPVDPTADGLFNQPVSSPRTPIAQAGTGHQTTSTATSSSASVSVELDLREVGLKLAKGVACETARGIKLVALFLALGCPDRIRFEYTYFTQSKELVDSSVDVFNISSISSADDTIGNGLRRLLHLNASDYLLHRNKACRHCCPTSCGTAAPSGLPLPSAARTSVVAATSNRSFPPPIRPMPPPRLPLASNTMHPLSAATPLVTMVATLSQPLPVMSTCLPASMLTGAGCQLSAAPGHLNIITDAGSGIAAAPAAMQHQQVATPFRMPITTVNSNLLLLGQTKNQICVVERQLDHRPKASTAIATLSGTTSSPASGSLRPVCLSSVSAGIAIGSLSDNSLAGHQCTSSGVSFLLPGSEVGAGGVAQPSSSLSAVKAFNTRRRANIQSRYVRHRAPLSLRPTPGTTTSPTLGLLSPVPTTPPLRTLFPASATRNEPTDSGQSPVQFPTAVVQANAGAAAGVALPTRPMISFSDPDQLPKSTAVTMLVDPTRLPVFSTSPTTASTSSMGPLASSPTDTASSAGLGFCAGGNSNQSWSSDTLASLLSTICQHQSQHQQQQAQATDLDGPVVQHQAHANWLGKSDLVSTSCDTPRLLLASPPAFAADISLTDSMAADVLNNHQTDYGEGNTLDSSQLLSGSGSGDPINHPLDSEVSANLMPLSVYSENSENTVDLNLLLSSLSSDNLHAVDSMGRRDTGG